MLKHLNPPTVPPPAGRYSQVVEIPPNARWVFLAGQVGARIDGSTVEGFEAQCEQAWRNLEAALEAAQMGFRDVVRLNYYLVDPAHVPIARAVRDRFIEDPAPAATLVIVKALASPAWLFELEAVAAKH
ncbi:MAG TPA: RidA family protein [Alphaproteobacteria bacterium]|nr:RidA family protein [Alphaproteobacteria bacterium]